MKDEIEQ
jgi:hypothetical protein